MPSDDDEELTVVLLSTCSILSLYLQYANLVQKSITPLQQKVTNKCVDFVNKFKKKDSKQFRAATRMSRHLFDCLYELLKEELNKAEQSALLPAEFRLFLTLVYLAHGNCPGYLTQNFEFPAEMLKTLIIPTCDVISKVLLPIFATMPKTAEWQETAAQVQAKCSLPNCVGAIGAKYMPIECEEGQSESCLLIIGICDVQHVFRLFDVSAMNMADMKKNVFCQTEIGMLLAKNNVNMPMANSLSSGLHNFPYYVAANDVFPLKPYMMKPYPGRHLNAERLHFNALLSAAHSLSEHAFDIVAAKWKILNQPLQMQQFAASQIVQAIMVLHNFLQVNDNANTAQEIAILADHHNTLETLKSVKRISSYDVSQKAFDLRNELMEYLFFQKFVG